MMNNANSGAGGALPRRALLAGMAGMAGIAAGVTAPASTTPADPVFAAIARCKAAEAAFLAANHADPDSEEDLPVGRIFWRVLDETSAVIPTTSSGAAALAAFIVEMDKDMKCSEEPSGLALAAISTFLRRGAV